MMPPRVILRLLQLEDRLVPTVVTLVEPWPVPDFLTVSFAPDSATVSGEKSALSNLLKQGGSESASQLEILRAFQTWASVANINFALVKDDGSPFGTPGQIQGDDRFGDIRIGARLMSIDSLANAIPFDWSVGTWSGDVLFNSAAKFGINPAEPNTYDLFTTVLHEAGHILGLGHSDDPSSIMSEQYAGGRFILPAAEVEAIRGLLGGRIADAYEGQSGNETWDSAAVLYGSGEITLTADLTSAGDVDYYRFLTAASQQKFVVRLATTGVSLLTARISVYDSAGRLVATDHSVDPRSGDLEIKVDRATGGNWYTIRVEAARGDVFGIGRYELSIAEKNAKQANSGYAQDGGVNDAPSDATTVDVDGDRRWAYRGVIENKNDVDYYRVSLPTGGNGLKSLLIEARSLNKKELSLTVEVFDSAMNPIAGEVVGTNGGSLAFRSAVLDPGGTYFVRVRGDGTDSTKGNYRLRMSTVDPPGIPVTPLQVGTLAPGAPTATARLAVTSSRLFQFNLNASGMWPGATITLSLTDASGKRIVSANYEVGENPLFLTRYLAAGEYTLTLTLVIPKNRSGAGGVSYWLSGGAFSNPVGPYGTLTAAGPGTSGTTGTTTLSPAPSSTTDSSGFTFTPLSLFGVIGLPYSF